MEIEEEIRQKNKREKRKTRKKKKNKRPKREKMETILMGRPISSRLVRRVPRSIEIAPPSNSNMVLILMTGANTGMPIGKPTKLIAW